MMHNASEDERPWGHYVVLIDEELYKVKKVTVKPDLRLSLQKHKFRDEHWFIVTGEAKITIDDKEVVRKTGECIDIYKNQVHRIQNCGKTDLIFIEVQTGTYFGEDDIIRLEDDYNRIEN